MRNRFVRFLATGFGAGNLPMAPGTAGSLVGVGWWWFLTHAGGPLYWMLTTGLVFAAVWIAGQAAQQIGEKDPACVVIDELVAIPVAFVGLTSWWLLLAFALFRLFDIWKPWPIRQSQHLPGGWGIVVDDLLAASYAGGLTHLIVWAAR
jgi:phosphatidylglycerophosphatase A